MKRNSKKGVVIKCIYCNRFFKVSPSNAKEAKYCEKECKDLHRKKLMKGKVLSNEIKKKISFTKIGPKNPAWIDGRSLIPYPIGWTDTFKEQIRLRDFYECQICSKSEKRNKRKLDVHHMDSNKNNLNPSNLITLCQACHIAYHNKSRKTKKEKCRIALLEYEEFGIDVQRIKNEKRENIEKAKGKV